MIAAIIIISSATGTACGLEYTRQSLGQFDFRAFATADFITGADAFALALSAYCAIVKFHLWREAWFDRLLTQRRSSEVLRGSPRWQPLSEIAPKRR